MTPAQNTAAYIQGFEDGKRTAMAEIKRELAKSAVQEGWKLVPNRPTKAMWDAWDTAPFNEDETVERNTAWSLMIAAAPQGSDNK